jgi:DNA-binding XRE family transcriptional regulator
MPQKFYGEKELAALVKQCREQSGKSRAQVARELNVSRPTIFYAEEKPERGLHKLRKTIIETYSEYRVSDAVYLVSVAKKKR